MVGLLDGRGIRNDRFFFFMLFVSMSETTEGGLKGHQVFILFCFDDYVDSRWRSDMNHRQSANQSS